MKKSNSIIYHVIVFTLAQLAWFSMLALWIYWYVSNYIILTEAGEAISSGLIEGTASTGALVSGIILLVVISVGMSLIFIYLTRQMNITRFYDNFIANVTHELKSPLSSIQLYLETIKQRNISAARQEEFISLMLKDTERLNDLITSILDISGLEQKKLAYNFHIYEADETIHELIKNAVSEYHLPESAVKIEGTLQGQIVVDKRSLRIVINNLIDNAVKYSKERLQLHIMLETSSQNIILQFTDHGIGISAKDQKVVFKKFQRIYSMSSPNVKGTGLGLYWVREILKAHGGRISVSSAGIGTGSSFRIELPVYKYSKRRYINRLLKLTRSKNKYIESENE